MSDDGPFLVLRWVTTEGQSVALRVSEKHIASLVITAVIHNGWKLMDAQRAT